jgi:GT2 family glycosyltransferase
MSTASPTTVIVPVYGDPAATGRCLESLLRHAPATAVPHEILVIDDCSPDPEVRELVERLAGRAGPVRVRSERHTTNRGFVGTVNRAMAATTGDVVLLNSDTVVTHGWLDRLHQVASSAPDVATVTPLTNAGSICTLPEPVIEHFELDGPDPRIDECGAFVARFGLGLRPAVISGVGFCMLVRRDALDRCGLFDEDHFGRGYGEEVDFCLRATRLGFVHLVDDRTFVHHAEGRSFGPERITGMHRSRVLLRQRYPFFEPSNRLERAREPSATSFEALVQALDEPPQPRRPHVLHVLHRPSTPPGGTERHVDALVDATFDRADSSVLSPVESGFLLRSTTMTHDGRRATHHHLLPGAAREVTKVDDEVAAAALRMALDLREVDAIHLHNLIGHSLAPLRACERFPGPVVCTLHDYYLACPNHSLLYRDLQHCAVPEDLDVCARCLPQTAVGGSLDRLLEHRRAVERHLGAVDRFVAPDVAAADHVRRAYDLPEDRVEVIPHGSLVTAAAAGRRAAEEVLEGPLRFAFVGRGWHRKGLGTVNALATELAGTAIELHHFGPAVESVEPAVHAHGPYENSELPRLLHDAGIHVVLLPGPYAETYSYVMSEALVAGLPVIGAGYGALGHRIRAHGVGWVVDPTDRRSIRQLLEDLDRCRAEVLRATRRARALAATDDRELADRYLALYGLGATDADDRPADQRTASPTEATMTDDDRMRRHLRALSAVNWQLQAQLGERPRPRGARVATRIRLLVERAAPRAYGGFQAGAEATATTRELAAAAVESVRRRRSAR